jgi:hypothetical protein
VTPLCDGLLTEARDGSVSCDQGTSCQAAELRDDAVAYRAAHARLIGVDQAENQSEFGGEG